MSWGAVAGAAVTVTGGALSSRNNRRANRDAQRAYEDAYNRNRSIMQPWLDAGGNALNQLFRLNAGNYSGFHESPDYQFALNQGLRGLDRSAAARGGLYSGGHSADVMNYASGLASQNYNNYYNRLAELAQMGQNAAGNLAGVNNTYANQSAGTAFNRADNRNALIGLVSGVGGNLVSNIDWGGRNSAYGDFSSQANQITQQNNRNINDQLMGRWGL